MKTNKEMLFTEFEKRLPRYHERDDINRDDGYKRVTNNLPLFVNTALIKKAALEMGYDKEHGYIELGRELARRWLFETRPSFPR